MKDSKNITLLHDFKHLDNLLSQWNQNQTRLSTGKVTVIKSIYVNAHRDWTDQEKGNLLNCLQICKIKKKKMDLVLGQKIKHIIKIVSR